MALTVRAAVHISAMCFENKETGEPFEVGSPESLTLTNLESCMGRKSSLPHFIPISDDPVASRLNLRLTTHQGNVFLDAFELRYGVAVPLQGRQHFISLAASGNLKTVIKYALAQPMAALTRFGKTPILEMPKPPSGYEHYSGYRRFLIVDLLMLNSTHAMRFHSRLTEVKKDGNPTTRAVKACFDLTQMKNICPKLIFQDVVDSVKDHHDTLTNPENPEVTYRVERIVNHIAQTIFPPLIRFDSLPPAKLTDRSALLEERGIPYKLKSGAGFKYEVSDIYNYLDAEKNLAEETNSVMSYSLAFDTLFEMSYDPRAGRNGKTSSLHGLPHRDEYESDIMKKYFDSTVYPLEGNRAAVVALLEPLKVRTISIDSGILRYLASRLQKYLWKILSQYPIFDLIKGVKVEDTIDFLVRGLPFVSGDYKGATDSIFHNSTDLWVTQIFDRLALPSYLKPHFEAIKRDFTRVLLDYSDVYNQEGKPWLRAWCVESGLDLPETVYRGDFYDVLSKVESVCSILGVKPPTIKNLLEKSTIVRQARGQLMGNVLSFPILCLINLTGYLNAAEEYINEFSDVASIPDSEYGCWHLLIEFFRARYSKRSGFSKYELCLTKRSFGKLPVRVNGDDILFQASQFFYRIWSRRLNEVGFVKSVGKNYFSDQFFTINSQIFVPRLHELDNVNLDLVLPYTSPNPFFLSPVRINHLWWAGLSPDFLRKRSDYVWLVGAPAAKITDARSLLGPVQRYFLGTVPVRQKAAWNTLFLHNMKEFLESFDSYGLPLYSEREWAKMKRKGPIPNGKFAISRSLPVSLGGLGLELNVPEILTYSQKILAGRLSLDSESLPIHLGESPQIQWVIRMYRKYLTRTVRTELVSPQEYERRILEDPHIERLQDYVIRRAAALYPFWRTAPPDDIVFTPFELRRFTEAIFSWSLRIRRSLKEKFATDLQYTPPLIELLLYVSSPSVTLDEGV